MNGGIGVAVGDYDDDGWSDIYVSNFGKNRLYHNNHDGTFTDVAEKAGVALGGWSAGSAWGDYDHDGLLDLFVPGYVKFDPSHPPGSAKGSLPASACQFRGVQVMCGPRGLIGERDHLFHNNGDGTFTDVSEKSGVADAPGYFGLASVFVDVDDDGWVDLLVANDSTPNYLYKNRHNGTFEDVSYLSGFALSEDGREQASMGIAVGDFNHDGKVDFYVTSFSDDYNTLYINDGDGNFTDKTASAGLVDPTIPSSVGAPLRSTLTMTAGPIFLYRTDTSIQPLTSRIGARPGWSGRSSSEILTERNFQKCRRQREADSPSCWREGAWRLRPLQRRPSRRRNQSNGRCACTAAQCNQKRQSLDRFPFDRGPKSPRDAIGAKVFVTAGGIRQRADVFSGGSYGSSSDQRVHFGLGHHDKVERLKYIGPAV